MRRSVALALGVFFLFALTGMAVKQESGDRKSLYYVCNCKDDCSCTTVSAQAGKCACGQELAAMHLLAIEKSSGVFCRCGAGCSCERDKKDPGKCGCGKPVKTVSLTESTFAPAARVANALRFRTSPENASAARI